MEEHKFYSGLIIKIGAKCFFCNQEGHFRMNRPLFWEAVKNQSHSKHKLAFAAEQNTRNRQAESDLQNKEATSGELTQKTVNAVTYVRDIEPETGENMTGRSNCITMKLMTGKPFGITKIGARIMSIITVGGHEITRSLSEPSDQTLMDIDVYADYLGTISPQTPSRALRALLMRVGGESIRIDSRYTETCGPHQVKLNLDGFNIYTKTMITCD